MKFLRDLFGWDSSSSTTGHTNEITAAVAPEVDRPAVTRHGRLIRLHTYDLARRGMYPFGPRIEAIIRLKDELGEEVVTVDQPANCSTSALLQEGDPVTVTVAQQGMRSKFVAFDSEAFLPTVTMNEPDVNQSFKRKGIVIRRVKFHLSEITTHVGLVHREGGECNAFLVIANDEYGRAAMQVSQLARFGGSNIRVDDPVILSHVVPNYRRDNGLRIGLDADAMALI